MRKSRAILIRAYPNRAILILPGKHDLDRAGRIRDLSFVPGNIKINEKYT